MLDAIHDYLGEIDPIIVRGVITQYLPQLKKFCEAKLAAD
jgi:uncharacterized protein with HEPN domain